MGKVGESQKKKEEKREGGFLLSPLAGYLGFARKAFFIFPVFFVCFRVFAFFWCDFELYVKGYMFFRMLLPLRHCFFNIINKKIQI